MSALKAHTTRGSSQSNVGTASRGGVNGVTLEAIAALLNVCNNNLIKDSDIEDIRKQLSNPDAETNDDAFVAVCICARDAMGCEVVLVRSREEMMRVPYLKTMMTTDVGTNNGIKHNLTLPEGCTAQAFTDLVEMVRYAGSSTDRAEDHNDVIGWPVGRLPARSIHDAIALIMTADFLGLDGAVPSLVAQCRATIMNKTHADMFTSMPVKHAAIQDLCEELRGCSIAEKIDVPAMIKAGGFLEPQMSIIEPWLKMENRTKDEIIWVCNLLGGKGEGVYSPLWSCTLRENRYDKYNIRLTAGALDMVLQLVKFAMERPQYFEIIIACLSSALSVQPFPGFKPGMSDSSMDLYYRYEAKEKSALFNAVLQGMGEFAHVPAANMIFFLSNFPDTIFAEELASSEFLIDIILGQDDESVTSAAINALEKVQDWQSKVTTAFLDVLPVVRRYSIIISLMPAFHLTSPEVQEYITAALQSEEFD